MFNLDNLRYEISWNKLVVLKEEEKDLKKYKDEFDGTGSSATSTCTPHEDSEWEAVCRYVDNGAAEIDNNTAKRMMKPICLGRKNYLFCGSEAGAKNASLPLHYRNLQDERTPTGEVHCRGSEEISGWSD